MRTNDVSQKVITVRGVARSIVILVVLVSSMVVLSGRWDWWPGWAFLAAFTVFTVWLGVWMARTDPELMRERNRKAGSQVESWDRAIVPWMVIFELAILAVAALDAGRFRWSYMPLGVQAGGWLMMTLAGAVLPWVFKSNTYASSFARVQGDRAQTVISTGPYRFVRHPMYAAVSVGVLALPVALGSWWALIPGGLLGIAFGVRAELEDCMLRRELPGYVEYAEHVRYRLIPGIW